MASPLRQSSPSRWLAIVSGLFMFCLPSAILAQHVIGRPAGGAPAHVSTPIMPHSPAPFRAPVALRSSLGLSSSRPFGITGFHSFRHPIRPFPPFPFMYPSPFLLGQLWWGWNSCWWASCELFWPSAIDYPAAYSPGPVMYSPEIYEPPPNYYGEDLPDLPQLFLKDGSVLNVTDYWVAKDRLHFTMIEQEGAKPVEHDVPYEALDVDASSKVNTARGFRFVLRDEPFEQYVRDHPEGPPPAATPTQP